MRRTVAAGVAALSVVFVITSVAGAAERFGGFRGGGFRGGFRGGVFIGPGFGFYNPLWWPYYYPGGFPYLPPQVIYQYAPPAGYLAPPNAAQQQFWYRCGNPAGYFPYVQNCVTGWEQVPATRGGVPPGPTPSGPVYDPLVPAAPPPAQR